MTKRLHFWWPSKVLVTNYPEDLNSDFIYFVILNLIHSNLALLYTVSFLTLYLAHDGASKE